MKPNLETEQVLQLLSGSGLPIDDIRGNQNITFITEFACGRLCGVIGIETLGEGVLLRSLAVEQSCRGSGIGRRLVNAAIAQIRQQGHKDIYLLTTNVQAYFTCFGFHEADKKSAPESIRQCAQFESLCPDDSTLMIKTLLASD